MSGFETAGWDALGGLPTRGPFIMCRNVRCRIQTKAGYDRVSVAAARVNSDPFAAAAFPVPAKFR